MNDCDVLPADGSQAAAAYLQLTVDHPARLLVAYSGHGVSVPAWLHDWRPASETFAVSDGRRCTPRALYQRSVTAGEIVLGGNLAAPAGGAAYPNYVLIVTPAADQPEAFKLQ